MRQTITGASTAALKLLSQELARQRFVERRMFAAARYAPALHCLCGQIERKAGKHEKRTLVITIA
jgi:hypothetical protein